MQSAPASLAKENDLFLFVPIQVGAIFDRSIDSSPTLFGECHSSTKELFFSIPAYPLETK